MTRSCPDESAKQHVRYQSLLTAELPSLFEKGHLGKGDPFLLKGLLTKRITGQRRGISNLEAEYHEQTCYHEEDQRDSGPERIS